MPQGSTWGGGCAALLASSSNPLPSPPTALVQDDITAYTFSSVVLESLHDLMQQKLQVRSFAAARGMTGVRCSGSSMPLAPKCRGP